MQAAIACLIFCLYFVRIPAVCTNIEASLSSDKQPRTVCPGPKFWEECAAKANISWLERPPLISNKELLEALSSSEKNFVKEGILPEVIKRAFNICCLRVGQHEIQLNYELTPKKTLAELHTEILRGNADIILPVYSARDDDYGGIEEFGFVEVLTSPRLAIIVNSESLKSQENVLLQVLTAIWPTALLAIILAAMSGIILWALETAWNTTMFPRPFHRGAFDGFWWAFVTMSTVGYGDKVPRSSFGRIFAIIWMMIGITICSTLTATLTSTLNNINADKTFKLTGKKIAVIDDTQGYYEGIRQGAEVKAFHTFQEMQRALLETREVEAILEEIHPAVYSVQNSNDSRLVILKHFESERRYGFVINNIKHPYLPGCVRSLIKDNQKDIFLLINKYLTQSEANDVKDKEELFLHEHSVGVMAGASLFVMIAFGLVFQLSSFLWRKRGGKAAGNRPNQIPTPKLKETGIAVPLNHTFADLTCSAMGFIQTTEGKITDTLYDTSFV